MRQLCADPRECVAYFVDLWMSVSMTPFHLGYQFMDQVKLGARERMVGMHDMVDQIPQRGSAPVVFLIALVLLKV